MSGGRFTACIVSVAMLSISVQTQRVGARSAKRRSGGLKRSGKPPVCSPASPTTAVIIARLKAKLRSKNAKTRRLAVLRLGFYPRPTAVRALIGVLQNSANRSSLRAYAAYFLARMGGDDAILALRSAAPTMKSGARNMVQMALRRLCPTQWKGKRLYVKLRTQKKWGWTTTKANTLLQLQLHRMFMTEPKIVIGWPSCIEPSPTTLRTNRVRALRLTVRLKGRGKPGKQSLELSFWATSYANSKILGTGSVVAAAHSKSKGAVLQTIAPLVRSASSSLRRFLGMSQIPATATAKKANKVVPTLRPVTTRSRHLGGLLPSIYRRTAGSSPWLRLRQRSHRAILLRIDALLKQRQPQQAYTHLRRLLRQAPNHRGARERLAIAQTLLGNHRGALRTLRWIRTHHGATAALTIQARIRVLTKPGSHASP